MNSGRTVFAQLMDHLPAYEFRKCVERYRGDRKLTYREACATSVCARSIPRRVSRQSLEKWRIDFAQTLIGVAGYTNPWASIRGAV